MQGPQAAAAGPRAGLAFFGRGSPAASPLQTQSTRHTTWSSAVISPSGVRAERRRKLIFMHYWAWKLSLTVTILIKKIQIRPTL